MVFLGFSSLSIVRISIAKTIGPRIDTVRVSKTSVSKSAVSTISKTTVSIGPVQSISISLSFSLSNMKSSNRVSNIAPTSSVAVGSCRANSGRGTITTHGYGSTLSRSSIAIGSMGSNWGSIAIGGMGSNRSSISIARMSKSRSVA